MNDAIITLLSISLGFIVFFGILLLISESRHHSEMLTAQRLVAADVKTLDNKVKRFDESIAQYTNKYIENNRSMADVHDHLAKVTDQMRRLNKAHIAIKNGIVKRIEIVVPGDFKAHLKSVAQKIEQLS